MPVVHKDAGGDLPAPQENGLPFERTARGFIKGKFKDRYDNECSLQKSSIAFEDCIWLGVDNPDPKILPGNGTGWHPYPLPENVSVTTRMHLTREQVAKLLPALQRFVEQGTLCEGDYSNEEGDS